MGGPPLIPFHVPPKGGGHKPPEKKKESPASAKNKALADKLKGGGKK
jgi:hypothetical protein